MWRIPPEQDGAFVARMEHVLNVYARPYNPRFPVVCMDEQPFQLLSETRSPMEMTSSRGRVVDYEYTREGTCCVWMFVEPLGCWRDVRVTSHRKAIDWAAQLRLLVDHPRYADAEQITLVCGRTHDADLLFRWFLDMSPEEAVFDATAFTHNWPRMDEFGITAAFFEAVVLEAVNSGLCSDDLVQR